MPKKIASAREGRKPRQALKDVSLIRLGRAFPAIILAILCTYAINRLGMLHAAERVIHDWEMTANRRLTTDIVIVEISDFEYDALFGGRSPLEPEKLRRLMDALARSKPRVIGVDVDTSHPDFRNLRQDPRWPTVIWERDIYSSAAGEEIEPVDILGGQDPSLNAASGIPALLDDPQDKVTRLYTRCIATKAGLVPTFVFAVAEAFRDGNAARVAGLCSDARSDLLQPFFIRFSADWMTISHSRCNSAPTRKKMAGRSR
jgi:CHASE2 domain-containing sensor protein